MPAVTGYFQGAGGIRLFYRYFQCPGAVDTLVILHGHGEHSGRYEKFFPILQDQHLSIGVYDARGYGLSEGREVYVESFEDYLRDLTEFIRFLQEAHGQKGKIYLLGHSLGGLVAVHWALRFPERLRALFLSSPFLGLRLPGFLILMNSLLNRWNPGFIYRNPVYPPHLTHNPEEVRNYRADKLIKRKISVRLLDQMLLYQTKLEAVERFRFPFPVYIMAAGLEKVVDLERTQSFFRRMEAPRKEMKIFDDFYHEIFNELEQEKAFDFLKFCIADARNVIPWQGPS